MFLFLLGILSFFPIVSHFWSFFQKNVVNSVTLLHWVLQGALVTLKVWCQTLWLRLC